MNRLKLPLLILMLGMFGCAHALDVVMPQDNSLNSVVDAFKYMRAIHIMAMLLLGFGFLMVFVRRYGRSALTATYLAVAISIPLYMMKASLGWMGESPSLIEQLILAEFAGASLLICAGAVLGRLRMYQYLILGLLFVPAYAFNEWVILNGGLGIFPAGTVVDTGGSIVIHAFGAWFGLGAIFALTSKKDFNVPIQADENSDRFSLLGSMILWVFWPSFCAALVPLAQIPATIVNVILALCGSTLLTYFATVLLRRKIGPADIANATLAGGVAIGSACAQATPIAAFVIGMLAGALSTFGFAIIQGRLQHLIKKVDTCGVMYLHGLPGILGGLSALCVVWTVNPGIQLAGIALTLVIALVTGLVTGLVISWTGSRQHPYEDAEEFDIE